MARKVPGGNNLIKVTAKNQRKVGTNLINASKYLEKAGKHLQLISSIKLSYTKKNKTRKARKARKARKN